MSITENIKIDTTDNQSDETYTTPISPLSPKEESPVLNDQEKENTVNEMQSLIQSSNDLTFPLEDSWSFWFFKNDRQCEWKDNLIQITTVSTVESFWSVYNHLQVSSRLGQGCDYFLFKTHIVRIVIYYIISFLLLLRLATNVGRSI
jgi:translation initiation factor 4E